MSLNKFGKSKKNNLTIMTIFLVLIIGSGFACKSESNQKQEQSATDKKVGLLLVNHGSRSETWRQALLNLETNVKDSILSGGVVKGTKTAFMEYNEPSIATRLKEFDNEGFTDVIIVPIFLTVSPHPFDDIPTIIGQKEDPQSVENLKIEKIERYTPKARIQITPLLDFTEVLQKNILKRAQEFSKKPNEEGLVLMAYGDETYMKEWTDLLNKIGNFVQQETGINQHSYGWCGHVAHYNSDSTTVAISRVLKTKNTALVIPVLVARDEMFQVKIIGDGIAKIKDSKDKVVYKADSILPDKNIEDWVITITNQYAQKIMTNSVAMN